MEQKISRVIITGFVISVVSALAAVMSGFGSRLGLWNFMIGFLILLFSIVTSLAGVVVSITGLVKTGKTPGKPGIKTAAAGILIGLIAVFFPASVILHALPLPAINDITTDTVNPPLFEAILDVRKNAPVSSAYPGAQTAAKQLKAYPDIKTMEIHRLFDETFDRALIVAGNMGWKIISTDKKAGRIEATDTTMWYGFTDDIVIRINQAPAVTILDIRSVSRVGLGDAGTNAARIRKYLDNIRKWENPK
jgi:uncharacterized protein (DUF1499 family)